MQATVLKTWHLAPQAFSTSLNWLSNLVVGSTFPAMLAALGIAGGRHCTGLAAPARGAASSGCLAVCVCEPCWHLCMAGLCTSAPPQLLVTLGAHPPSAHAICMLPGARWAARPPCGTTLRTMPPCCCRLLPCVCRPECGSLPVPGGPHGGDQAAQRAEHTCAAGGRVGRRRRRRGPLPGCPARARPLPVLPFSPQFTQQDRLMVSCSHQAVPT